MISDIKAVIGNFLRAFSYRFWVTDWLARPPAPHGAGVILQLTLAVPAVASVMTPLIHMSLAMKSLGI